MYLVTVLYYIVTFFDTLDYYYYCIIVLMGAVQIDYCHIHFYIYVHLIYMCIILIGLLNIALMCYIGVLVYGISTIDLERYLYANMYISVVLV